MKKFRLEDQKNKITKNDEEASPKDARGDTVTPPPENGAAEDHGDEIKPPSKMNGQKLIGAAAITEYFKKDFVALVAWKTAYHFPLKKEAGLPTLYLSDLEAWLAQHEIDLENLSTDYLRRFYDRKKQLAEIETTPDEPLNGIDEIVKATGRPGHIIIQWMREYEDSPFYKKSGILCCDSARDLRRWMDKKRIVAGRYPFSERLDGRGEA